MKTTSDLTKYQATSIDQWQFDSEEMKRIEPKDEIAKAALNKFINRNGSPIDVHRTNGRRVFNPFTAMKRTHRKFVSYQGSPLIEIDAANSHPLIMVHKMIAEGLDVDADMKVAVESGTFYDYLIQNGRDRDETKDLWFSFCYAKKIKTDHPIYPIMAQTFPLFMDSFERYASDKNLSEYLQELESRIWIDKISTAMMRADIHHVTIHDSVLFAGVQNINKVLDIIHAAFGNVDPPLHVEYLTGDPLVYKRVANPDNAKYLNPEYALLDELHLCKADPWRDIDRPETAVYMKDNSELLPIFTTGNFSAISGKSKSGKTLLISTIVAAALKGGSVLNKFTGELPQAKRGIVYIDTEQAEYDLQWVMKRVMRMADIEQGSESHIAFYRLREKSTDKRNELIELAIKSTPNVGLVVIDGVRDIVKDINNPEESTLAINNVMRWTDVYKLHLIAVLHQNPGQATGNKLRGHIGTEAMNKAEAVISVIKADDADHAMVSADFMRRAHFKAFGLKYDKDTNLPVFIDDAEPMPKIKSYEDINDGLSAQVLNKLFANREKYGKPQFIDTAHNLMMMMRYNITKNVVKTSIFEGWIDDDLITETHGEKNKKTITKNHELTPPF